MKPGTFVRWENRFGNAVVGEVVDQRTGQDICSNKADYCLRPDEDETVVRVAHWEKEDGLRRPTDSQPVHYARNVEELECEEQEYKMVCHGPDRDYDLYNP